MQPAAALRLFAAMNHEDEPLFDPDELDQTDIDRYESAAGWDPNKPLVRPRENARKTKIDPWNPGSHETMLETRPAAEWQTRTDSKRSPELFLDIWHEGEVCVLLGPRGSYKSIFAVQLAECLARGKTVESGMLRVESSARNATNKTLNSQLSTLNSRRVLYFDFQRTQRQWTERYSSPPDGTRRRRKRYAFSRNFERTALAWDGHLPEFCKGDLQRFLEHSIVSALEQTEARVIIIDDISYLVRSPTPAALTRILKTLRLWITTFNISILVLAQVPSPKSNVQSPTLARTSSPPYDGGVATGPRPAEGVVLSSHSPLSTLNSPLVDHADSAFAILPSTFGPNYRYLKHLTSTRPITHDESNVLTLRLKRRETAAWNIEQKPEENRPRISTDITETTRLPQSSPPCIGGVAALHGRGGREPSATEITEATEPADSRPPTANCFLGLELLGPASEQDHLRDYESHLKPAIRVDEATRLKRLRSGPIVDILLSPEYKRYLKGE